MTVELRDYQQNIISDAREALKTHRRVLIQAPTGAGKTVLASFMAQNASKRGRRVFFVCHRRELIDQTSRTFNACDIEHGYIAAGYPRSNLMHVQIASVDTLKNRLESVLPPDIVIWDEAHHLAAGGWTRVYQHYNRAFHVGLSATPERLDGRGLDDKFDALIPGPSVSWLMENGFLANYRLFSIPGVDMTGARTVAGDFSARDSERAMDKAKIVGDIVRHWRKYGSDKITIGFAVSIRHSQAIVERFKAAGIPAAHLDGNTKKEERRRTLQALARGELQVVWNVGLFGEGYDLASNAGIDVSIGCVIDAAPTQSLSRYLQRCGRALRPQESKAVILDHAGNALRHGLPCEERTWTLEGRDVQDKNSEDSEPVRQCPECFAVHKPFPQCPECGYQYVIEVREDPNEVDAELEELDPVAMRRAAKKEQGRASTLRQLISLGQSRGYRNPVAWARHVYNARVAKRMA